MEILGIIDLPTWLMSIVCVPLLLYLYTRYHQSYFTRLNIPTKRTIPMLGDLPVMISRGLHYVDADLVQKNGKCFGSFLGNAPTLLIADPEMIKQITVKEFSKFTDRYNAIPIEKKWESALNVASGEHWRYLRSILSPSFSSGKMRNMNVLIQRSIDIMHEILAEKMVEGSFDFVPVFKGFTMDVICSTGFGLDVNSQKDPNDPFIIHCKKFLDFNPGASLSFLFPILFPEVSKLMRHMPVKLISDESMNFFQSATTAAFEERKKGDTQFRDLLQLMLQAKKGNNEPGDDETTMTQVDYKKKGMTDEEILINSIIFIAAGFDTTANTLVWMSYCLATNQAVQEKLFDEIEQHVGKNKPHYDNVFKLKYLDMVMNETLRLYPATPRINRQPSEDTVVCGYHLPKGLDCTIAISAIQMLPEYWPDPEKFDPERFSEENEGNITPYTYLPFGSGPRNCVGLRLAQLEIKMAIVSILQKYKITPDPKLKIPPELSKIGLTKPKDPMMLKLHKREESA